MKMTFCFLSLCLPLLVNAQEYSGIRWTTGLSYEEVKSKAKTENKYIFIDVYATWCGPCKTMDKEIYPLADVGKLYNEKFVSIRVQADRTERDDSLVRRKYNDAKKICMEYKVGAFPTFLFITPEGKLLHRTSGALNMENFMTLANDALQQKGYTVLVEKFRNGEYESLNMKDLAISAKYARDDTLAKAIASAYVRSLDVHDLIKQENMLFVFQFAEDDKKWAQDVCMLKLKDLSIYELANPLAIRFLFYAAKNDSLAITASNLWVLRIPHGRTLVKDTLEYLKSFMRTTKDESFRMLYENTKRVDEIMGVKNWAQWDLDNIIIKEEYFNPIYNPAAKLIANGTNPLSVLQPDWKMLDRTLTVKYGAACADRLRFYPKISWFKLVGNQKEYVKNLVAEMERTRAWNLNGFILNNYAMEIFRYSTSRKELERTASWIKRYYEKFPKELQTDAAGIDTYAILLYKAGKIKQGIEWERKAALIDPADSSIARTLSKMQKGLAIWPNGFDVID